jgi:hypothetical protein
LGRARTSNVGSAYAPDPVEVQAAADGAPVAVVATAVEAVREVWVVADRWWTSTPLRRRYYELALADGRCVVVFRDLESGRWFAQPSPY